MPHVFPTAAQPALMVGRTPRSAADALVGLRRKDGADFVGEKRVRGTRADQGVRPAIPAGFALREVASGFQLALPALFLATDAERRFAYARLYGLRAATARD
jgi:hypothetical protein